MLGLEVFYRNWFSGPKGRATVKQSELLEEVTSVCQGLQVNVVPCLDSIISSVEEEELEGIESLKYFAKELGHKKLLDCLKDIKTVLITIANSETNYKKLISNIIPNVTTDVTITIRELAIMNLVDSLSVVESYSYDLVLDINSGLSSNIEISKMARKRMLKYASYYINAISYFKKNKVDKIVESMKDEAINTVNDVLELPEGMKSEFYKEDKNHFLNSFKNFFSLSFGKGGEKIESGFIGNPIYHIGMMWVDYQKYRNDKRILAKQATEQVLLELKMKRTETYDPKLEKQIEWYSNRLHELEYKISEYERK